MRVQKVSIKDFGNIMECEIELPQNKNMVTVGGANRAGKTTFLRAIFAALGGNMAVTNIRKGQEKATVELTTEKYIIKFTRTQKTESLKVVERKRPEFACSAPKTLLKTLFETIAVFPEKFINAKANEKAKVLLEIINIPFEPEQFRLICGEFENEIETALSQNPIEVIDSAETALFNLRKIVNRDLKREKAIYEEYQGIPDMQPVNIAEMVARHKELANLLAEFNARQQQRTTLGNRAKAIENEIQALKHKIFALQDEKEITETQLRQINEECPEEKYSDLLNEIADHNKKVEDAAAQNQAAEQSRMKGEALKNYETKHEESERLSCTIEKVREYRKELLGKTNFPVPNMGFENGVVTYNGFPFEQASGAEQLYVALNVALWKIPKDGLRTLFFFDPPMLGNETWERLAQFAEKNDVQILIAQVVDAPEQTTLFIKEGIVYESNS